MLIAKKLIGLIAVTVCILVPTVSHGQANDSYVPCSATDSSNDPSKDTSLFGYREICNNLPQSRFGNLAELQRYLINDPIGWITWIVAVLALFGIIYSGLLFITAGGNADQATKARSSIVTILIGIVIYILIFWILTAARSVVQELSNPTTTQQGQ
jgi:hypothetical protein